MPNFEGLRFFGMTKIPIMKCSSMSLQRCDWLASHHFQLALEPISIRTEATRIVTLHFLFSNTHRRDQILPYGQNTVV